MFSAFSELPKLLFLWIFLLLGEILEKLQQEMEHHPLG